MRPCLQELGDDDGNDDVSWALPSFHFSFKFLASSFWPLTLFHQDVCEDELPDAISEDDSWPSEHDDSDAEKPRVVVPKRASKVPASKKTPANKLPPASANPSASTLQHRVQAVGQNAALVQDGALSVPASLHMPAVPFESVDFTHFDGVDEDYGED